MAVPAMPMSKPSRSLPAHGDVKAGHADVKVLPPTKRALEEADAAAGRRAPSVSSALSDGGTEVTDIKVKVYIPIVCWRSHGDHERTCAACGAKFTEPSPYTGLIDLEAEAGGGGGGESCEGRRHLHMLHPTPGLSLFLSFSFSFSFSFTLTFTLTLTLILTLILTITIDINYIIAFRPRVQRRSLPDLARPPLVPLRRR